MAKFRIDQSLKYYILHFKDFKENLHTLGYEV